MALLDTRTVTRGPVLGGVGKSFTTLLAAFQTWNDNRRTRAALTQLRDPELEDIGLTRGDIDALGVDGDIIR